MIMNTYYVYCYKDQNTIFYIGKGTKTRKLDHLKAAKFSKRNTHFLNRIRKLLKNSTPPIIEIISDNLSEAQALELEIELIKKYGRLDRNQGELLNETDGGEGSSGHISPRKGKTFDEYFGLNKSYEIKDKLSKHMISRHDEIISMNKRIHTGKKISSEQIEKTRIKNIGKTRTDEQKQSLSNGMKGIKKTLTNEQRQLLSIRSKKLFENTIVVNNGTNNKRIAPSELTFYLEKGWSQGGKSFSRKKNLSFDISAKFLSAKRTPRKCEFLGVSYNQIKIAAFENKTTAYFIKTHPSFKFLEN